MTLRTAHGNAARRGAVLVAETPPLDELPPLNAADTAKGLEVRKQRGKPFQKGNAAAQSRGPALARIGVELKPATNEERQLVRRRAATLRNARARELSVQHAGLELPVSVGAELASWALALSWSRLHYDRGEDVVASQLAERASAHLLKAEGYATRAAQAVSKGAPLTPITLTPRRTT